MSRSTKDRIRDNVRETKNAENMTPTNVTSTYCPCASNRKTSTVKRFPLGELKKSEVDSAYNTREASLKQNKCEISTYESHVKTVEKRKVIRDKKGIYTSVKIKQKTISSLNQNTNVSNKTDKAEKGQSSMKENVFVTELLKNVTERELFGNSPCILDITGIGECALIRESTDKVDNDKINIIETNETSETSKTSRTQEASGKKNQSSDYGQKKQHYKNSTANCQKGNKIELTKQSFNYYLEKRKEQKTKALLNKLSKDDDSALADFLEQRSLKNGYDYNRQSEEPQIVINELPTTMKKGKEMIQTNDSLNVTMQSRPLNKTYVVKSDDGNDSSSYYAKLPFIDSLCNESLETEIDKNVSDLMRKIDFQDYKISTDSKYVEVAINGSLEKAISSDFSTDIHEDFNSTCQDAYSIQTAPVIQDAKNVFHFRPSMLKKTPCYIYKTEFPYHPAVKNIKYSLKRPSSRELSLRTSGLPVPSTRLTKIDLQNSSLVKPDPQALIYSLEYLEDIIKHLLARECEISTLPNNPLKYDVTEINRSIIVNWLIKLNTHLQDGLELLEAGVRLFDHCISRAPTPLKDLQLLGTACYWLAQKLLGIGPPRTAGTMARRCGGAFGAAELLRCERRLLRLLAWPSVPVLAESFAQYALRASKPERPQLALSIARYLLMAALLHTRLATLPPSRLAPAAVAAALRVCSHDDWPAFWTCRLCHSVEDIISLEKELLDVAKVIRDPDCLCREPYYLFCQTRHHAAALRVTTALDRSASSDSYFSAK